MKSENQDSGFVSLYLYLLKVTVHQVGQISIFLSPCQPTGIKGAILSWNLLQSWQISAAYVAVSMFWSMWFQQRTWESYNSHMSRETPGLSAESSWKKRVAGGGAWGGHNLSEDEKCGETWAHLPNQRLYLRILRNPS
jgi:hypothetical protein